MYVGSGSRIKWPKTESEYKVVRNRVAKGKLIEIDAMKMTRLMTNRDLTVTALSDESRVSPMSISKILSGEQKRVRAETLHKLSTFFGVKADELLPWISSREFNTKIMTSF